MENLKYITQTVIADTSRKWAVCAFVSGVAAPLVLIYLYIKKYKRLLKEKAKVEDKSSVRVLATKLEGEGCYEHIRNRTVCGDRCAYKHILVVASKIDLARHSVSLCMYIFTCDEIYEALLRAHQRGVRVRVVSDATMAGVRGSKLMLLQDNGIPVKIQDENRDPDIMIHHKFCLVDANNEHDCLAMNGSLNYTLQGFVLNMDIIVITDNRETVRELAEAFSVLWDECVQYCPV